MAAAWKAVTSLHRNRKNRPTSRIIEVIKIPLIDGEVIFGRYSMGVSTVAEASIHVEANDPTIAIVQCYVHDTGVTVECIL